MGRKKTIRIPEGQEHLPFRGKGTGVWSLSTRTERRILVALSALCVSVMLLYVYFLIASVAHVAARGELAGEARILDSRVASLEATYLSRSTEISESYARSVGFVPARSTSFVEKRAVVTLHTAP